MREEMNKKIGKIWNKVLVKTAQLWLNFKGINYKKIPAATAATATAPAQVAYARLCAIYEGDMKMDTGQFIRVFLLQMMDPIGHEYICPVYADPNTRDTVRAALTRCKPIHMLFNEDAKGNVSFKTDVEVKDTGVTTPKEIMLSQFKKEDIHGS